MILKNICALYLALIFCTPAFAETEKNHGSNIYVPDYRLEKIYQVPEGDIYTVRGGLKRMDDFVELWTRIIPRDNDPKTLDIWKSEKVAVNYKTAYAQVKLHFYCSASEAAIPAAYMFDEWSQLIDSKVDMMDEPFSIKDKPIINQIKKLACNGKIDGHKR